VRPMGAGASSKKQQYKAEPEVLWYETQPEEEAPPDSPTSYEVNREVENKTGFIGTFYMFDAGTIHRGAHCVVRRIVHKSSRRPRALKQFSLKNVDDGIDEMRRQVNLMTTCAHPNVLKLYESFADRQHYYFVFEYCAGGKLTEHIDEAYKTDEAHTERETACVMQQMFRALAYMHSKNVCHRDIRPEHVLIKTQGSLAGCSAKVIDFGCAKETFTADQEMTEKVGKAYYRAPEVTAGRYTQSCDLWSCGVVMYLLLIGYPRPQGSKAPKRGGGVTFQDFGSFFFDRSDWDHVSERARMMLDGLLEEDVNVRFRAEQVVEDEWITRQGPQPFASRVQLGIQSQDSFPRVRTVEFLELQAKQNFPGSTTMSLEEPESP